MARKQAGEKFMEEDNSEREVRHIKYQENICVFQVFEIILGF